jgi:hypothetical protein
MARKLTPSLKNLDALEITRSAIGNEKLVYVLLTDKSFEYRHNGKSRVGYIGTTKVGIARLAQSAAGKATKMLRWPGVKKVTARIVTCLGRRKVETWKKLERAMLLEFRSRYGDVPWCNSHGKKIVETDEFSYFSREAIRRLIIKLN